MDKTFFAANHVTVADLCLYDIMKGSVKAMNAKKISENNCFIRWFDLIQHLVDEKEKINFALKEEKSEKAVPAVKSEKSVPAVKEVKDGKKKKEKPKQEAVVVEEIAPITRVDIRVGRITAAIKHADADSLYVETVDVGEENPRTVVSGLSGKVPLESLPNTLALFVCNLKPAAMRGIKSEAMILVASSENSNGETVYEVVKPPAGSQPGDKVFFEGVSMKVDEQLNPKKKIIETVKVDWKSVDGIACYQDKAFCTEKGKCFTEQVLNGPIS